MCKKMNSYSCGQFSPDPTLLVIWYHPGSSPSEGVGSSGDMWCHWATYHKISDRSSREQYPNNMRTKNLHILVLTELRHMPFLSAAAQCWPPTCRQSVAPQVDLRERILNCSRNSFFFQGVFIFVSFRIQTSEDIESGGKKPCVCGSI